MNKKEEILSAYRELFFFTLGITLGFILGLRKNSEGYFFIGVGTFLLIIFYFMNKKKFVKKQKAEVKR